MVFPVESGSRLIRAAAVILKRYGDLSLNSDEIFDK